MAQKGIIYLRVKNHEANGVEIWFLVSSYDLYFNKSVIHLQLRNTQNISGVCFFLSFPMWDDKIKLPMICTIHSADYLLQFSAISLSCQLIRECDSRRLLK